MFGEKFVLNKIQAESGVKVSTVRHIKLWNEMAGRIADFRCECMREFTEKCKELQRREVAD